MNFTLFIVILITSYCSGNTDHENTTKQATTPENPLNNERISTTTEKLKVKKIYGGLTANITDYSWMALLEYETDNGTYVTKCAGSLINQRYILTAAHCVSGKILIKVGKLIQVRLGEFDTSTKVDCVDGICVDETKYIPVEKIIVHEGYNDQDKNRAHDIALVRLAELVEYTKHIQSIALPASAGYNASSFGDTVTVSGWGRTLTSRKSITKMALNITISDQEECAEKYKAHRINISDMQLCAGGVFQEDTCDGDSGGPLVVKYKDHWVLEGIVSFGRACGLEGWPGIYTRVSQYENWIADNVEP